MADLLIQHGRGPGLRYQDIENAGDVWHWWEAPPADAGGGVPYAAIAALGDVSRPAPFLYTVELDIAEPDLPAIYEWYEQEHLPLLTAVPGCIGGTRYRRLDGGAPNLLAAYRFERPEVNQSPEWIAARSTPWCERVRPLFRSTRRFVRRLID
ncbi:hypothetical protein [Roseicella frigidaeris]|uniref:DUF1330 domain-containing protein n=1 Tax=Roseicella frigidaeris TaxID=2230885 RepID=A0A327MFV1_9PROT|nr:hypothetical protein [Roseicella frigidaeris]RAI59048.1 hypothetical protein DOO78_10960 [Roseicella frigidaeris]